MTYPNTQLFINGQWCDAEGGRTLAVFNPSTGTKIGRLAHAGIPDLERAAQAAHKGFEIWRDTPANERSAIMRKAAALMRERTPQIAELLTQEQGKPLAEAIGECIGQGHRRIAIAPLFMAQGGHLKNDVPRLLDELQQRYPDVTLHLMPAVGDVEALRAAMADWLVHHTPAL